MVRRIIGVKFITAIKTLAIYLIIRSGVHWDFTGKFNSISEIWPNYGISKISTKKGSS